MYKTALIKLINQQSINLNSFTKLTRFSYRWISTIFKSNNWNPLLSTLICFCKVLNIDLIDFMIYAETGRITSKEINLQFNIFPSKIANTLKRIRLEKGLSQTQLAQLTNFQVSTISLREHDRYQSYPTLFTLETYCKAFKITVSEFLIESQSE